MSGWDPFRALRDPAPVKEEPKDWQVIMVFPDGEIDRTPYIEKELAEATLEELMNGRPWGPAKRKAIFAHMYPRKRSA